MNKQILISLVLFLFFSINNSKAQNTICGSELILNQMMQNDPTFVKNQIQFEQLISLRSKERSFNTTIYKIPVVVHVIHQGEEIGIGSNISDAQIKSAISNLTTVYRGNNGQILDTQIEFHLAKQDENCNATTGIVRVDGRSIADYSTNGITFNNQTQVKALSNWANDQYYNIWVTSKINGSDGGGIQGFTILPNGFKSNTDGAVILYNAFGYDKNGSSKFNLKSYTNENKTVVHEIGHGLNLLHTFSGDKGLDNQQVEQCPPVENGCLTYNSSTNRYEYKGDCCNDTPPHKRSDNQCNPLSTNTCNSNVSLESSIRNFMSYSSKDCKIKFTPNQRERMRQTIELLRPSLLTSKALSLPNDFPREDAKIPTCKPSTQSTGLGANYTGIQSVTFGAITNLSGYPSQDSANGYLDATECIRNFEVGTNGDPTLVVKLSSSNGNYVKAWIDFNNDGEFDTSELVMNQSNRDKNNAATLDVEIREGVELRKLYNLRVICDLIPIADACINPQYGQVEDYAVEFAGIISVPVNLISFSGKVKKDQVNLNWETASEINNAYFSIERSLNGVDFEKIAQIQPIQGLKYQWIDKQPVQGLNYYRLSQTDFDGQSQILGNTLSFEIIKDINIGLTIAPNPISESEEISIQLFSNKNESILVQLFDINGQIQHSEERQIQKGNNQLKISPLNLPKGVYLLKTKLSNYTFTKKVIYQ